MIVWTNDALPSHDIGTYTYGIPTVIGAGEARLRIGKFCSISDGVVIFLGAEHNTQWFSTYPFSDAGFPWWGAQDIHGHPRTKGDVVIGNDVWIGYKTTILSGITVGDGACIGAHSVVTRNVAAYTIVAGNPARFIRQRFNEDVVQTLLRSAWWDWPQDKIKAALPVLMSGDVGRLRELLK